MNKSGDELSDGRSRRQSKEETRRDLLETGRRLLKEHGAPDRINIRLADVLKEHGLTTGAAYHIWGSQKEFQEDLAGFIASDWGWEMSKAMEEDPNDRSVAEVAITYFDKFKDNDEFFIMLQLWGVKDPSEQLCESITDGYDRVHEDLTTMLDKNVPARGRRFKGGLTASDAAVLVTALTEGLAVRGRFDRDRLTGSSGQDLYVEALTALVTHMTEPIE